MSWFMNDGRRFPHQMWPVVNTLFPEKVHVTIMSWGNHHTDSDSSPHTPFRYVGRHMYLPLNYRIVL